MKYKLTSILILIPSLLFSQKISGELGFNKTRYGRLLSGLVSKNTLVVDPGSEIVKIREGNVGSIQLGLSSQIVIGKKNVYLGGHYSKITNQAEISALQGKGRYRSTIAITDVKLQVGYVFNYNKFSFIPKVEFSRQIGNNKRTSTNSFVAYPGQNIEDKRFLTYKIEDLTKWALGLNLEVNWPLLHKDSISHFVDGFLQYSEQFGKYGDGVMRFKDRVVLKSPLSYVRFGFGLRFHLL